MSAFLVTEQTMANLAETICNLINTDNVYYYGMSSLKRELEDCLDTYHDLVPNKVARKLFFMNDTALRERYGDDAWWLEDVSDTDYTEFKGGVNLHKTNKFQFLKSLQCYLYQCCEGKVTECNLYKLLREMEDAIKSDIICHTSEYENAEWG